MLKCIYCSFKFKFNWVTFNLALLHMRIWKRAKVLQSIAPAEPAADASNNHLSE